MELFALPRSKVAPWHPVTTLGPCSAPEGIKLPTMLSPRESELENSAYPAFSCPAWLSFTLILFCFSLISPS